MKNTFEYGITVDAGMICAMDASLLEKMPHSDDILMVEPGYNTITLKIDNKPVEKFCISVPTGGLYVGDPCYYLEGKAWTEFLEKGNGNEDGQWNEQVFEVSVGDGTYYLKIEVDSCDEFWEDTELIERGHEAECKYLNNLPLCMIFGSADVGTCKIGGKKRYCTWGRNFSRRKALNMVRNTGFELVKQPNSKRYEILVPEGKLTDMLQAMLAIK